LESRLKNEPRGPGIDQKRANRRQAIRDERRLRARSDAFCDPRSPFTHHLRRITPTISTADASQKGSRLHVRQIGTPPAAIEPLVRARAVPKVACVIPRGHVLSGFAALDGARGG